MSGLAYYILDTETTGLVVGKHEINQISIIRCSDRVQLTRKIKVDRPEDADWNALKIQGITVKDLKEGISKEEAVKDVVNFLEKDGLTPEHRVIVAHNASFDRRHCHGLFRSTNTRFPAILWMDTIAIAKAWGKQKGLGKFSAKLGIPSFKAVNSSQHQALPDTQNTYLLWYKAGQAGIDYLPFIKREEDNIVSEGSLEDIDE